MDKWTEIEQFRHVVKYHQNRLSHLPRMSFTGTVKIHGANAGISLQNGSVSIQSRKRVLTKDDDLYGISSTFSNESDALQEIVDIMSTYLEYDNDKITMYGEWCGCGIQSKVAVSQLQDKHFVVFGMKRNGNNIGINSNMRFSAPFIHNIYEFGTFHVDADMTNPSSVLEQLTSLTLDVENQCPVGKALGGIDGLGEGIVWTCDYDPYNTNLWFKTKGEKHSSGSSAKKRNIATIEPEKLQHIQDVVDYVLPEGRLQQGLEHVDDVDIKHMGAYLKWVCLDVRKEELDTIEHNGLDWKDVVKPITSKARSFFTQKSTQF